MDDEQTPPARMCEWCGGRIQNQPSIGRLRVYCRQSCRQRAHEERQQERRIAAALAAAPHSSQADTAPDSSRDETVAASRRRPRRALRFPDGQLPLPESD
jgi:hypothetical protein